MTFNEWKRRYEGDGGRMDGAEVSAARAAWQAAMEQATLDHSSIRTKRTRWERPAMIDLTNADFLALVHNAVQRPTDSGPWKVAADWLDEHGAGELAALFRTMPHLWPVIVPMVLDAVWNADLPTPLVTGVVMNMDEVAVVYADRLSGEPAAGQTAGTGTS